MDHRILLYPHANEQAVHELAARWERLADTGLIGTRPTLTPEQRATLEANDALFRARAARLRAESVR